MRLSTKGRYGLKAMFELALNYGSGPVSLSVVSEKQNISVNYLEQLIAPLRKAGFVKSVRGAQGGYLLAKDPSEISVGDILKTLEGPLSPSECIENDKCSNKEQCVTKFVWEKIRDSINDVVDGITLKDMIDDHNNMTKSDMYYI